MLMTHIFYLYPPYLYSNNAVQHIVYWMTANLPTLNTFVKLNFSSLYSNII